MPRSPRDIAYTASSETIKKWSGIVEEHEDNQSEARKDFNEHWKIGASEEGVDRGLCTQITKLRRAWERKGTVAEMRQRFLFYFDCLIPDDQRDMFAQLRHLEHEAINLGLHEAVDKAQLDLKAAIAAKKSGTDLGEGQETAEQGKAKGPRRVA